MILLDKMQRAHQAEFALWGCRTNNLEDAPYEIVRSYPDVDRVDVAERCANLEQAREALDRLRGLAAMSKALLALNETLFKGSGGETAPAAWKDHSRRNSPDSCYETRLGSLRLIVVRNHIASPDRWVVDCLPFYNTHQLDANTVSSDVVKGRAMAMVAAKLYEVSCALKVPQE